MNQCCIWNYMRILVLIVYSCQLTVAGPLDVALSWAKAQKIPFDLNIPWLNFDNETRCYGEIGCLTISKEWYHLIHRPFNVFPLPRSIISTKFILYTIKNPTVGHLLNANDNDSLNKSNFLATSKTKFIIHGFIDTPLSNWISDMRSELLTHGNYNVIVVNWAGGSLPLYTQATANTRLVGLEIAYLLKILKLKKNLVFADVHLIGHSLGAHIAGYVGERVPGIGRITGLDPAEPYFQGMGSIVRLDPTDANFVDVLHTDGRSFSLPLLEIPGYGMTEPCGHVDFYPNNGKEQPGCILSSEGTSLLPLTLIKDGIEEASRVLLACNHVRAVKLFTDSINGKCQYIAHRCPSYEHFLAGHCFMCKPDNCAVMGYNNDYFLNYNNNNANITENEISIDDANYGYIGTPQPGKYFLLTGKDFPFCQTHYRLSVNLANPKEAESWVQGYLTAKLITYKGGVYEVDLSKGNAKFEHGSTFQAVITNENDFSDHIKSVELSWSHDVNVLEPRSLCLLWCNDHLYVKSISIDIMKLENRSKRLKNSALIFSPLHDYADIATRGSYIFFRERE